MANALTGRGLCRAQFVPSYLATYLCPAITKKYTLTESIQWAENMLVRMKVFANSPIPLNETFLAFCQESHLFLPLMQNTEMEIQFRATIAALSKQVGAMNHSLVLNPSDIYANLRILHEILTRFLFTIEIAADLGPSHERSSGISVPSFVYSEEEKTELF